MSYNRYQILLNPSFKDAVKLVISYRLKYVRIKPTPLMGVTRSSDIQSMDLQQGWSTNSHGSMLQSVQRPEGSTRKLSQKADTDMTSKCTVHVVQNQVTCDISRLSCQLCKGVQESEKTRRLIHFYN